ncbi:MAG: SRPBCC family protein [Egibacteraceae bacterium]
MRGSASIVIEASPEAIYAIVSDVTRLGELSPECHRCEWNEGSSEAVVGATFTGHNRLGTYEWATQCEVIAADPGRVFAFEVFSPQTRYSRWTYELELDGAGTRVTETFEVLKLASVLKDASPEQLAQRQAMLEDGMRQTLTRLKKIAET